MIIEFDSLELFGRPVFSKLVVKTPVREAVPLPSSPCFAYIMEGDSHYLLKEEDIKAEPGKVILSLCGSRFSHLLSRQCKHGGMVSSIVVHFQKEVLRKVYENSKPSYWKELEKPIVKQTVQEAASALIKHYFEGLLHLFDNPESASEDMLVLKLKEIILLLLQRRESEIVEIVRSLFSERIFGFKEIVEANIYEPVAMERLAALTNHSLTSFKKEFKRIYNTTPGAYIIRKRVERVADLLTFSDENICRIGYQCGFTSPAHLSRVFKSRYGITPSEYRSQSINV
jgi:AraC-like DNA-binding protein